MRPLQYSDAVDKVIYDNHNCVELDKEELPILLYAILDQYDAMDDLDSIIENMQAFRRMRRHCLTE